MTNQQDLMGLAKNWRSIAQELRYSPAAMPFTAGYLEKCADELEQALREAAAQLGRMESIEPTKDDVEAAEDAYREAVHGIGLATPKWSSLAPMWHALRTFISRRPQLPAGGPEYDRELIAEMLDDLTAGTQTKYTLTAIAEQTRLLREADNRDAAGVHTAKREDGVPDGWVLVPREPTPEMLRAGFLSESEGFDIETPSDAPGLVYRAMLAAAPQPDSKESR